MSIHGIELIKEVTIVKDGGVLIELRNKKIVPEEIGLPGQISELAMDLKDYLVMISECGVCVGKEVPEETLGAQSVVVHGREIFTKFAPGCEGLMRLTSRGNICTK